jgi:hypothetical protein
MPEKKTRAPQYTTPPGEFIWPWLNKADDRPIKGKPQKPAYKLNIQYAANNPAWLMSKETLDELVEASYDKAIEENPKKKKVIVRQYPYAMETDDDGEETGKVILKLKQNAAFTDRKTGEEKKVFVALFDASGKPIDRNKTAIFGGSVGVASFTTRPYLVDSTNGAGISLDLRAVQVLQLVSSSERTADSYGFAAQEGYEGSDEDDEEVEERSAPSNAADPTDF